MKKVRVHLLKGEAAPIRYHALRVEKQGDKGAGMGGQERRSSKMNDRLTNP